MFLNDVSLRFRWSERCCYPSCLLPSFPVHRSRFPAHGAHVQIGVIRRSKAFNTGLGTIAPIHPVRALVTPYRALYGVWLASSRGVPVVWGGTAGVLPPRFPAWGSGVLPTVGRGR